ncbi:hypothetical protein [Bradyrhizobium jicamae]|uniref:hypothetical protein n=1 Tax=Bradyrhizobium jicamae TaxID=280332 RepID=UPI001BADC987|nr:hypothetical protein [Bradyrhizobium jicamae]MBR0937986.1 hypothetical protein [Bradyrhizobium jicamae]
MTVLQFAARIERANDAVMTTRRLRTAHLMRAPAWPRGRAWVMRLTEIPHIAVNLGR